MSYIYSDRVTITNVTRDATFGNETITATTVNVKCCIQDTKKTIVNMEGAIKRTITPDSKFYFQNNVTLNVGDYVEITKLHGKNLTGQVKKKIKKTSVIGLFSVKSIVGMI